MIGGEELILRFHDFNGKSVSVAQLKDFRQNVEFYLDSIGHGPYVPELKNILARITKAIKKCHEKKITEGEVKLNKVEDAKPKKESKPSIGATKKEKRNAFKPKSRGKKKPKVESKKLKVKRSAKKVSAKEIKDHFKNKIFNRAPIKKKKSKAVRHVKPKDVRTPAGSRTLGNPNREKRMNPTTPLNSEALPITKNEKPTTVQGFASVTADQAPAQPANTFTLPGEVGKLLGNLQAFKLEIVIPGETHSSKTQLGMQVANAFAGNNYDVAWVDWEQGGIESKDTQNAIARNVDQANKSKIHIFGSLPRTLDAVKALTKQFKVIALDSGSKLNQVTNAWIDTLREEYPDTIWIIMMQQNEKGGTRGGSAAEFDAPVVLKTYRPDPTTHEKNYATVFKNRGNPTGLFYSINGKKIISDPNITTDQKAAA